MADPRYLFEPIYYQALTPIHVGSGQDVGLVDLPVVRERTTDHPFLPGSGIRGALRDRCEAADAALARRIFGNERSGGDEGGEDESDEITSGCLSVLDAHLLLFPVRSAPGLFRWITCPFALDRHRRLWSDLCGGEPAVPAPPQASPPEGAYLGAGADALYLEEYRFDFADGAWSWSLALDGVDASRVVLVSDDVFLHFVRTATLVRQRNRLSTAKTVLRGHLFSVESLPAETWFLGFTGATRERLSEDGEVTAEDDATGPAAEPSGPPAPMDKETVARELRRLSSGETGGAETHLTLGGDESVGLGITRLRWSGP